MRDAKQIALIADDDPFVRMDVQQILEDAGFFVYAAAGVDHAMKILADRGDEVQLLFTDVQMPPGPLTGFDLARRCAKEWPHIGIVVASGGAEPQEGELPDGAVFINKPFSAEVVIEHVKKTLPKPHQPDKLRQE
ncbi:response regulator [uncultured Paracoccus sp.]|uniref:response regulator n=1 Tax=uncultured Paracoccus sp. TaxID=189685 RepID=UPI0032B296D8|tara:strand:+ start:271 stop:675 length:405 start_codon:yes stop_codon:yes gene_type:complete